MTVYAWQVEPNPHRSKIMCEIDTLERKIEARKHLQQMFPHQAEVHDERLQQLQVSLQEMEILLEKTPSGRRSFL